MADPIEPGAEAGKDSTLLQRLAALVPLSQLAPGQVLHGEVSTELAMSWIVRHLEARGARAWVDSLDSPGALLCHRDKPWDTDVLGIAVGAVACFLVDQTSLDAALSLAGAYISWAREAGYELLSARLDPGQIAAIQALEATGFRLVEVYVTLERDLTQHPPQEVASDIVAAGPADAERIGEIASKTFVYDRLHADPRVDDRLADAFKRAWGANSCRGYADKVLLVRVNGQIAGFITLRKKHRIVQGNEVALIDLIGVSKGFQGRGVGKTLVEAGCRWAEKQGLRTIEVGTQGANVPSLMLYRKRGFRDSGWQVTLHWLSAEGEEQQLSPSAKQGA